VRTGRNAGLWTVGVTYGFATRTLENEAPDVLVDSAQEMGAIFSGSRQKA
jgi:phosphoglycolate phosphatase-like HAD superfamily hydrolase